MILYNYTFSIKNVSVSNFSRETDRLYVLKALFEAEDKNGKEMKFYLVLIFSINGDFFIV